MIAFSPITTFGMPFFVLLYAGFVLMMVMFVAKKESQLRTVGIVDHSGLLGLDKETEFSPPPPPQLDPLEVHLTETEPAEDPDGVGSEPLLPVSAGQPDPEARRAVPRGRVPLHDGAVGGCLAGAPAPRGKGLFAHAGGRRARR